MRAAYAAAAIIAFATPSFAADGTHLKREIPVPGEASAFDYVTFDAGRLYVGHRPEGLQVFDVAHDFKMSTVENTKGSNGATLMPDLGLGVSHNNTGTITVFALADLKAQEPVKLGADVDSSRYDPFTHRLAVFGIPGADKKGSQVAIMQAPAMEKVAMIVSDAEKLEFSVADGAGGMFVAAQDKNEIRHIDMRAAKFDGAWSVPCKQPTTMDYDAAHKRLMVGCRGEFTEPLFLVVDATNGNTVFQAPISPGNDGIAYDAHRSRVVLTDGVGAHLVVFSQQDADHYALNEVVLTRPMAKTMALDRDTGDIYTVTAEGVYDPSRKNLSAIAPYYPNGFTKNSFRILQYGR